MKGVWGAPAEWVDPAAAQWLYVPFWGPVSRNFHAPIEYGRPQNGAVAAFQLKDANGKVTLQPVWLSTDIVSAEEVILANGVVFTYGSGERQTRVDHAWNDPPVPDPATAHAVMYALDAATGKELWNSGDTIAATNHFSGMSLANGRAYVGTVDSVIYCFGVTR
jgi:outer membrane protein assembly factor BamB